MNKGNVMDVKLIFSSVDTRKNTFRKFIFFFLYRLIIKVKHKWVVYGVLIDDFHELFIRLSLSLKPSLLIAVATTVEKLISHCYNFINDKIREPVK